MYRQGTASRDWRAERRNNKGGDEGRKSPRPLQDGYHGPSASSRAVSRLFAPRHRIRVIQIQRHIGERRHRLLHAQRHAPALRQRLGDMHGRVGLGRPRLPKGFFPRGRPRQLPDRREEDKQGIRDDRRLDVFSLGHYGSHRRGCQQERHRALHSG